MSRVGKKIHRITVYFLLLYIVTFIVVLPIVGHDLVFSKYFNEKYHDETKEKGRAISQNMRRKSRAEIYISNLNQSKNRAFYETQMKSHIDILFIVVTCQRGEGDSKSVGYLTQVVAECDKQMKEAHDIKTSIILCNVDKHPQGFEEAQKLSSLFPMIYKHKGHELVETLRQKRANEKEDYAFCLMHIMKSNISFKYLLFLQDDAVPYADFFTSLNHLLSYKLEYKVIHDMPVKNDISWAFLKLYYPEKWQGYSNEVPKLIEIIALGCIGGGFCAFAFHLRHQKLSFLQLMVPFWLGLFYTVLLPVMLGRQYLLELRRLSPQLLSLVQAPGCCIPAILYPKSQIEPIISYLNGITCSSNYPLDIALDDYAKENHLMVYLVEPNLFQHIGMYSTLTKPKKAVYFSE